MKSLNSINIATFANCTINEFDAPNLKSISKDYCKFTIGKKNFQDSPGIIKKVDFPNEEPDYEQMI